MDTTLAETAAGPAPSRRPLSPPTAVLLAIAFGLCGGYLDLAIIVFKKLCWNPEGSFRTARDFPWTVPVGHVVLLLILGAVVAAVSLFRPGRVSLRTGSWLFATIAIGAALLRMPMYAGCSLLLAAGLGRLISDRMASRDVGSWPVRSFLAAGLGLLGILAALSSGWGAVQESRAVAGLPPAPPGARNVVLIVWDTVRARDLSLYHYSRNTTPNLANWAAKGVRYELPLAPAPWTFPSHTSFFTGRWPYQLNSQWKFVLDAKAPTLAEYLSSRGYQTAGFVANTNCCNYETGLGRGFAHFEDYALTPWNLLGRTVAGKWILENLVAAGEFYEQKWISLQSRGARAINNAFLDWLGRRRTDRPFFAFLNFFDAHEPYIPPPGIQVGFGIQPRTLRDYRLLADYVGTLKDQLLPRDLQMVHDCYEDCIAHLDQQLGQLLEELQRQGQLANTDVIITSDHGEAFAEHGSYTHGYSVYLEEIRVPLVILSPIAPPGRVVYSPVSLRDLPATVVDLLGLSDGAPFPGHSWADYWRLGPGQEPQLTTPALTEQIDQTALHTHTSSDAGHPEFQMSLVALGHHYIHNREGDEELYDIRRDSMERVDLMKSADGNQWKDVLRRMLLDELTTNPGSVEVVASYLEPYRRWLKAHVHGAAPILSSASSK